MMTNSLQFEKNQMRKTYLNARKAMSATARVEADEAICNALNDVVKWRDFDAIAAYVSDGTEPDLTRFLTTQLTLGRRLAFPKSEKISTDVSYEMHWVDSLHHGWGEGAFQIREPVGVHAPMSIADQLQNTKLLWLIPGVAFSAQGARLGRGKSIYDRLLATTQGLKVGIFYDCQEAPTLPTESHDQLLDVIVTPTRILRISAHDS